MAGWGQGGGCSRDQVRMRAGRLRGSFGGLPVHVSIEPGQPRQEFIEIADQLIIRWDLFGAVLACQYVGGLVVADSPLAVPGLKAVPR